MDISAPQIYAQKITSRLTMAALCGLLAPVVLQACGGNQPAAETPVTETETTETETTETASAEGGGKGTLEFRANGEDFVRQGFTTKRRLGHLLRQRVCFPGGCNRLPDRPTF